jgi:hypothetical protein
MILTVKARRFVADAVDQLPDDHVRSVWRSFEKKPTQDIPAHVAAAALQALEYAEYEINNRLRRGHLDEIEEADLVNDLGFIKAVETDLRRVC